jgi:hypothetical protein
MLAVCAALATTTGLAHAGACIDQLATLQQAPQLSHQPVLESVRQAQTYSELMLSADLARAETLDAQGNEEKCREEARRAKHELAGLEGNDSGTVHRWVTGLYMGSSTSRSHP